MYRGNFVSPNVFEERSFHPVEDLSPFRPRILDSDDQSVQLDPFPLDMDSRSMQELEDACWNDPLFCPDNEDRVHSIALGLEKLHANLKEKILSAPEAEQASLISVLSSWARQVAQDPLSDPKCAQV